MADPCCRCRRSRCCRGCCCCSRLVLGRMPVPQHHRAHCPALQPALPQHWFAQLLLYQLLLCVTPAADNSTTRASGQSTPGGTPGTATPPLLSAEKPAKSVTVAAGCGCVWFLHHLLAGYAIGGTCRLPLFSRTCRSSLLAANSCWYLCLSTSLSRCQNLCLLPKLSAAPHSHRYEPQLSLTPYCNTKVIHFIRHGCAAWLPGGVKRGLMGSVRSAKPIQADARHCCACVPLRPAL